MNINPAAASAAGAARAATRGAGEADAQTTAASRQQAAEQAPAGQPADDAAIHEGDQTDDRGGNGRQVLDVFEHQTDQESDEPAPPRRESTHDGHLDLQA